MKPKLKIQEVSRFSEEFPKLQQFATTFDHVINPFASARVFEFQRGDTVFGYADVLFMPVVFPAFHPEITRPRDVVETLETWQHVCRVSHGGEMLLGVPIAPERKTFPDAMLQKLGFACMKRELYNPTNTN